jgi:hypothetical protein
MKKLDPWDMLRGGKIEQGLTLLRQSYEREPLASEIMELGVAYLWVKQYEQAFKHFQHEIKTYTHTMDAFFGMAGAAKWCLNDPAEAVSQWLSGLDVQYADAAGGIQNPLLLFTASILRPEIYSRKEAEGLLRERVADRRAENWPGPLAMYLLDASYLPELERIIGGDAEAPHLRWTLVFYQGILARVRGDGSQFVQSMRETADISRCPDEDEFLSRMWREEFFIARHEASLA